MPPDPEHKTITPEAMDRLAAKLADWDRVDDPVETFGGKAFANFRPGPRQFPAYAHFPGTGPAGTSCSGCEFVRARKVQQHKVAICAKFKMLMPGSKATTIDHRSPSCRYFEARKGGVADE